MICICRAVWQNRPQLSCLFIFLMRIVVSGSEWQDGERRLLFCSWADICVSVSFTRSRIIFWNNVKQLLILVRSAIFICISFIRIAYPVYTIPFGIVMHFNAVFGNATHMPLLIKFLVHQIRLDRDGENELIVGFGECVRDTNPCCNQHNGIFHFFWHLKKCEYSGRIRLVWTLAIKQLLLQNNCHWILIISNYSKQNDSGIRRWLFPRRG